MTCSKVLQVGLEPLATAGRPEPLHVSHTIQLSYQGAQRVIVSIESYSMDTMFFQVSLLLPEHPVMYTVS